MTGRTWFVEDAIARYLDAIKHAPSVMALQALADNGIQGEARLHVTHDEEDRIRAAIKARREELEGMVK